jgi:hypothetical protein
MRGILQPDALGLGTSTTADGAGVEASGARSPVLCYVGPLLLAGSWEAPVSRVSVEDVGLAWSTAFRANVLLWTAVPIPDSTFEGAPVHFRKAKPVPPTEFAPWTAAHFQTRETRDRFLRVAGTLPARDVEVEPMPDEGRGALVRWRPGQFLGLNDLAHAHGGRIAVMQRRGA